VTPGWTCRSAAAILVGIGLGLVAGPAASQDDAAPGASATGVLAPPPAGAFAVTVAVDLPAGPDEVFAAVTGDISGWWDHSVSGDPVVLEIEPRPGGFFREVFDDRGDGVIHAMVTHVRWGQRLEMVGPLGLAGHAVHMVTIYELDGLPGGGTRLRVTARAAGEVHDGWAEAVERTWRHFLHDRLQPWLAGGHHRKERP